MTEHVLRKKPSLATALWATSVPIVVSGDLLRVPRNITIVFNFLCIVVIFYCLLKHSTKDRASTGNVELVRKQHGGQYS